MLVVVKIVLTNCLCTSTRSISFLCCPLYSFSCFLCQTFLKLSKTLSTLQPCPNSMCSVRIYLHCALDLAQLNTHIKGSRKPTECGQNFQNMLMLQIAFLLQLDKNVDGTLPLTSGNKLSSHHLFPLVSYLSFSTTVFKSLLIYVVLTKTAEKYFNWGILLLSHEEDLNAQNYCVAFCFTGKEPQMHYYCSQLYFFNAVYTLFFFIFLGNYTGTKTT